VLFRERFAEELGDLLWYLTNVATKFGLSLTEIVQNNLIKCEQRWLNSTLLVFDVPWYPLA
jgi:NTP pyrophosphatase (non-canonical NTP hydrolase)